MFVKSSLTRQISMFEVYSILIHAVFSYSFMRVSVQTLARIGLVAFAYKTV